MMKCLSLFLFFMFCLSCSGSSNDNKAPESVSTDELKKMHIESLTIHDLSRFLPLAEANYEIEAHIQDTSTGESILCAGVDNGTQVIQLSDLEYSNLDINFVNVTGTSKNNVSEIKIVLMDREDIHCPNATHSDKDKTFWKTGAIPAKDFIKDELTLSADDSSVIKMVRRREVPDQTAIGVLTDSTLLSLSTTEMGDLISNPEFEVHVVDVTQNEDIACFGGTEDPLRSVRKKGKNYSNLFSKAKIVRDVDSSEKFGLLRLVLVEREQGSCPDAFKVGIDEIVTTSPTMTFDDLNSGKEIIFFENWAKASFTSQNALTASLSPLEPSGMNNLKLQKIKFMGFADEFSSPEIEIHLLDAVSGKTLACSGAKDGLKDVDMPNKMFENLNASFETLFKANEKISGLIRVAIVERDLSECPEPATRSDNDFMVEKVLNLDDLTKNEISFDDESVLLFSK